jgi:hypothetical protein
VIFEAADPSENAIGVDGPQKVSIRSIGFRGFRFGIWAGNGAVVSAASSTFTTADGAAAWVTNGASLELRGSLVSSGLSHKVDGIIVARGSRAIITDTEFRNLHVALDVFGTGSRATASRIVASERTRELSALIVSSQGAVVEVDHSRLDAAEAYIGGVKASDDRDTKKTAPATLRVSSSELIRSQPTDPSAFDVTEGSSLVLEDTTLAYRARIAISAIDASSVSLVRSVIRPVSSVDARNFEVGAGIVINDGARLSMESSAIVGSAQSAILASKECHIQVVSSLIRDTWEFERVDLRKRVGTGQAISLSGNAILEMKNSTLENNAGVSIWMGGEESTLRMERSAVLITETAAKSNAKAGVFALSGTVDISDSVFHGVPDTALALRGVTGLVSRTIISNSEVGFRVLGESRLVDAQDEARRPDSGEVLLRGNVLVELGAPQVDEEITLGTCRCIAPP